ncbi:MAG: hypothetical protein JNJ60_18655, partial [Rhodocyclaceae bacterium]|nr:hypothetical protein [Rhodocyclaceae bacterium]
MNRLSQLLATLLIAAGLAGGLAACNKDQSMDPKSHAPATAPDAGKQGPSGMSGDQGPAAQPQPPSETLPQAGTPPPAAPGASDDTSGSS